MLSRPPYEAYEDRRKYPRIVLNSPVEIRYQDQTLKGRVHDLSPDGLQIRCSRATIREIRPTGRAIKKDSAPIVDMRFALTVNRAEKVVEGSAALYYFVLLPGEKGEDVACGLEFRKLRKQDREAIDDFIVDAMTPVESKVLDFLSVPRTSGEIAEHVGAGTQVVAKLLAELVDNGAILSFERNRKMLHVRPAAAMNALLQKAEDLERRIAWLERAARGTAKK